MNRTLVLVAVSFAWTFGCGGAAGSPDDTTVADDTMTDVPADTADVPTPADVPPDAPDAVGETGCPQPVIVIEEGEALSALGTVHLHGEQSVAGSGAIVSYEWSLQQPSQNHEFLQPGWEAPTPTHVVGVDGEYTYCLDVCDAQRCSKDAACETTACKEVVVSTSEAIHCELTWTTPGDAVPFDTSGSNMDLHFVHPFATGPDVDSDGKPDGWFDVPYDCYSQNRTPEWESVNPNVADNPTLDRDDTDGDGPENVNLHVPVNDRIYRVGVHYVNDNGYGDAYPRLKCWIWGQLSFDRDLEALARPMHMCDLWEAAEIKWPQGIVAALSTPEGDVRITPAYPNPSPTCTPPVSNPDP